MILKFKFTTNSTSTKDDRQTSVQFETFSNAISCVNLYLLWQASIHAIIIRTEMIMIIMNHYLPGAANQRLTINLLSLNWSRWSNFLNHVLHIFVIVLFNLRDINKKMYIILLTIFSFCREQPSRLIDDDPLRIPPRRPPDFHGEW